jgi:hypothetical protein
VSESHLPDDVARWPDDPYVLLGVDRNIERRELRRAYVRLIRIYRPEHFSEQFRRIREAYERLDGFMRYQEQFGALELESSEPVANNMPPGTMETIAAGETFDESRCEGNGHAPAPPVESPTDVAWQPAREGQTAEAYRRLVELERHRPGNEELCLRLYWLLVLEPGLDPRRDRRDWLAAGLSAGGPTGPLVELYDRELEGDPLELRHSRCRNLLERPGPLPQRAALAMRCWARLGLAGCWNMVAEDLQRFREEAFAADRALWGRMLLLCEEQLRWQDDPKAFGPMAHACRREIEEYSEEHRELEYELDRSDYVYRLADELRNIVHSDLLPPETTRRLDDVIRRGWVQPFGMIRAELMQFLRPMIENPFRATEMLDRIHRSSPIVLHQLNAHVQSLYYSRHDFSDERSRMEERRKAVSAFFDRQKPDAYGNWRLKMLSFCLRRRMTFGQFQEAAEGESLSAELTEHWKKDLPLHCITMACEAFWA